MDRDHDLVVVGGGPGGMQAALEAARAGADVAIVDAALQLGGQYLRRPHPAFQARDPGALHHGWDAAERRYEAVHAATNLRVMTGTRVWNAERREAEVTLHLTGATDGTLRARTIVLATGATERVIPFPGWDLPGVLTLGGTQALLKWQGVRPGRRVVVAGAGPLLFPVASALVRTGTDVLAVCDATHPRSWLGGGVGLAAPRKALELVEHTRHLVTARVPLHLRTAAVRADGDGRVEQVTLAHLDHRWRVVPGSSWTVDADALCTSHGFVPAVELVASLGCGLAPGPPPVAVVDERQQTTVDGVYAVGELTGVAGADAATTEGGVAGIVAARALGYPVDRARERRFAAALARVTEVPDGWVSWLDDTTVVCRCEDVPYGRVRTAIRQLGARDLRSVKMTTRCGMGPCQARLCGATVTDLVRIETGAPPPDPLALSTRPVASPVPLGEL